MKDITTELRIGNWVTFDGTPLGVDVSDSPVKMDSKMFHAVIHGFKGYDPFGIPLTEEWLVKFGFKEICLAMNSRWFELENIKIYNHREYDDNEDLIYFDNTFIQCVHDLQNLYFALTREELTLK